MELDRKQSVLRDQYSENSGRRRGVSLSYSDAGKKGKGQEEATWVATS